MGYLKSFYLALPWYTLIPRNGRNALIELNASSVTDISQPLVRADAGANTITIYFPQEFPNKLTATLIKLKSCLYTGQWFNPQTGNFTLINNAITPINGRWIIPQKPDGNDWVLLLQTSGKNHLNKFKKSASSSHA